MNIKNGKRDWWRTQTESCLKEYRVKLFQLLGMELPDKPEYLKMIELEDEYIDKIIKEIDRVKRYED